MPTRALPTATPPDTRHAALTDCLSLCFSVLCAQRPTQPWELQSGGSSAPTESPIGQPRRHHPRLPPADDPGRAPSSTGRRQPGGHEGAATTTAAAAAAAARCVRLLPTSRCTGAAAAARSDEPPQPSAVWLIDDFRRPLPAAAAAAASTARSTAAPTPPGGGTPAAAEQPPPPDDEAPCGWPTPAMAPQVDASSTAAEISLASDLVRRLHLPAPTLVRVRMVHDQHLLRAPYT
eukprot:COSAG01_NODE_172_length_23108_cov_26.690496_24_plen_234_part_00